MNSNILQQFLCYTSQLMLPQSKTPLPSFRMHTSHVTSKFLPAMLVIKTTWLFHLVVISRSPNHSLFLSYWNIQLYIQLLITRLIIYGHTCHTQYCNRATSRIVFYIIYAFLGINVSTLCKSKATVYSLANHESILPNESARDC